MMPQQMPAQGGDIYAEIGALLEQMVGQMGPEAVLMQLKQMVGQGAPQPEVMSPGGPSSMPPMAKRNALAM